MHSGYAKCSLCSKKFNSIEEFYGFDCNNPNHKRGCDVVEQFENKGTQSNYAMVGPPESGKSYYMYALLVYLLEMRDPMVIETFKKLDITYELIGDKSLRQYDIFKKRLFADRLEATIPDADENFIPVTIQFKVGSGLKQKSMKLTFFDMSGEYFTSRKGMEENAKVHNAKGIIFFIDPYQDTLLNEKLKNPSNQMYNNYNILNNLYQAIVNKDRKRQIKVRIPVAFCISMFDLLQHHVPDLIESNPYLNINDLVTDNRTFDIMKVKRKTNNLRKFLSENSRLAIDNYGQKFAKYDLFAISAIGHDNVENLGMHGLKPQGILAPLLWLMAANGLIKTNESKNLF